jgi:hypothetical protein
VGSAFIVAALTLSAIAIVIGIIALAAARCRDPDPAIGQLRAEVAVLAALTKETAANVDVLARTIAERLPAPPIERETLPASAAPPEVRQELLAAHVAAAAPDTTPKGSTTRVTEQGRAAGLTRPEPWTQIPDEGTWPEGAGPIPRASVPTSLPKAAPTLDMSPDLAGGETPVPERPTLLLPIFKDDVPTLSEVLREDDREKAEARARAEEKLGPDRESDGEATEVYVRPAPPEPKK